MFEMFVLIVFIYLLPTTFFYKIKQDLKQKLHSKILTVIFQATGTEN